MDSATLVLADPNPGTGRPSRRVAGTEPRLIHRFTEEVASVRSDGLLLSIEVPGWKILSFHAGTPGEVAAVTALRDGADRDRLIRLVAAGSDERRAVEKVDFYLERFAKAHLLQWSLVDEAGEILRVESLAGGCSPRTGPAPAGPFVLGRFAYLRRMSGQIVLEAGDLALRTFPKPRGLTCLAGLLGGKMRDRDADGFGAALWRLGICDPADAEGSPAQQTWAFHEVLMHAASRASRDVDPVGATYRFVDRFPSPPARRPPPAGERLSLPPVDESVVAAGSRSLHDLQCRRRSRRDFADGAMPLADLSTFLWRVARVTDEISLPRQELLSRPYPAGGSIHELEFYVAAAHCEGLEPAVYHYDGFGHALVRLPGSAAVAGKMVRRSTHAMALDPARTQPHLVVTIATRLPRVGWKYQNMAYRLSLMGAGVVIQTMYLVATDMGLAPCGNGNGDSRLLEEAAGLDPFEETAIAEFALGVPAAAA